MALSAAFRSQVACANWSPDGEFLATVTEHLVELRPLADPSSPQLFPSGEKIIKLLWSPDSSRFLCLLADHTVRVFSVSDCQWTCAIDEGLLPVVAASWAPDSLHIVTASDCGMRLSVWSLCATPAEDPLRLVVMRPKFPSAGRAFSPSGAFWAVCTRVDCKDFLEIFHVSQDWVKLRDFQVKTDDLQGLLWTPSETSLVVWDTPLLARLAVYHISGQVLFELEPRTESLGFRNLQVHAKANLLVASGYDETIRVFSLGDWAEVFPPLHHRERMPFLPHLLVVREEANDLQKRMQPADLFSSQRNREKRESGENGEICECSSRSPVVYRQLSLQERQDASEEKENNSSGSCQSRTESENRTVAQEKARAEREGREGNEIGEAKKLPKAFITLPTEKAAPVRLGSLLETRAGTPGAGGSKARKENSSFGICRALLSPCGAFVASQNERQPCVIFLWSLQSGDLVSLALHREPVTSFAWSPHPAASGDTACLAIATNASRFFLWTPRWQSVAELSIPLQCQKLLWSPGGEALLLQEKSKGVIAYPSFLYSVPDKEEATM
ncbi:WDR8 protein isoform 3 family protein [Toxoplasma gondii GT1]|uniref:WDR8 protein isoform 3 family protein n=2 Tax=Toxoplasma gondii TaxID=5811 RepID=S7UL31_TOXGG|nr:WDR8 protein isoform 3 family protein [Toxoplasma gondii GT1]KAF4639787.1 WDR8 protein isoform 3 family protein [Toxoplasma gondii]